MSDNQVINFFLRNGELFSNNSIIMGPLRELGWFLFDLLVTVADACESLYNTAFGFVDFTSWERVNNFVDAFKPLFIALMAVSLFALGVILIFNHEKKPKILINICIAILCVTCSTVVFQQMNGVVMDIKHGIDAVPTVDSQNNGVYDIVSEHLFDIYYLDQKVGLSNIDYGENGENLAHPNVDKESMNFIDFAEVLDPDDDSYDFKDNDAKDILTQKLIRMGDGSGYQLKDIYNGVLWTSAGNQFYFRYKMDLLPATLQIIAVTLLYIALAYKCVRIAFELVFARLMAYLYSAELSGGQKIAKILTFIRDSYILLLMTAICVKLYYLMNAFIGDTVDNSFVKAIFCLFVAFCVIDGPNLVEKLLGMDAGLKSSTARMMAAYGVAKSAARTAMAPARAGFNYARQQHMMHKQADATSAAIHNAMGGNGADNQNTDFMEKDGQGSPGQTGQQMQNEPDNQAGKMDAQNMDAQNKGDTFGAGAAAAGAGIAAHAEDSHDTAFMDEAGKADGESGFASDDMKAADTSFMDAEKDKENGFNDIATDMNDNSAHGQEPASFMESAVENGKAETQMESAKADSVEIGQPAAVETTGSGVSKSDKGETIQVPDKFDKIMGETGAPKKRGLPENRVISQYKGQIFDRNINKDEDIDKK